MTAKPHARAGALAATFDGAYFSDQYRDYASQNPPRKLGFYLRVLSRYVAADRPADVLDVGCGRAAWLGHLARHTPWRLVGTDVSEWAIESNRLQYPAIDFRVAGATDRPFADAAFDAVSACDVLEHVPDRDAAIAALTTMLRPGGHLLAVVPVYDGLCGPIIRRMDKDPTHIHKLARREWLSWLATHVEIVEWCGIVRYLLPGRAYLHVPTHVGRDHAPAI